MSQVQPPRPRDDTNTEPELHHSDSDRFVPNGERIGRAADSMAEFNRLLKEVAKSIMIIAGIFFASSVVFLMYVLARFAFEVLL